MNKEKHVKPFKIVAIVGCLIAVLLIVIMCLLASITIKRTDIASYSMVSNHSSPHLYLFPRYLDNTKVINEYHYIDYQIKGGKEIVLDVTYEDFIFEDEINRLSNFKLRNLYYQSTNYYPEYKSLKYDDAGLLFNIPTYIARYNYAGEYEYACIDRENNRIIYVFLDNVLYDKIELDKLFIPMHYEGNYNGLNDQDGYRYSVYSLYPDIKEEEWYE